MGMVVRSNIMALNANRQLGMNNSAVSKSLEKLSSGYKINRAGDDASGLAISEKMKAQIKGLETASANSQDGISLIQTAEGALTEVHDMLNRMVELAGKAANGTIDDETDRQALQDEMDALLDEIDRISASTDFNGIKLLDGSMGGAAITSTTGSKSVDEVAGTTGTVPGTNNATVTTITAQDGNSSGTKASLTMDLAGMTITAPTDGSTGAKATLSIAGQTVDLEVTKNMDAKDIRDALIGKKITVSGTELTAKAGTGDTGIVFEAADDTNTNTNMTTAAASGISISASAGKVGYSARVDGAASTSELDFDGRVGADLMGGTVKIGDVTYSFVENAADAAAGTTAVVLKNGDDASAIATALANAGAADAANFNFTNNGSVVTVTEVGTAAGDASGKMNYSGNAIDVKFEDVGLTLQIGATGDDYNKVKVSVADMSSKGLGIDGLKTTGIMTQTAASKALDLVKNGADSAINLVSTQRAELGAMQNRLEHTINNLDVATENMESANSQIRDTDMAKEMMEYTKQSVLTQAAQAMLAQANQQPQSILQLLQ